MKLTKPQREARVRDALRWVAQEAKGLKMSGVILPQESRLREALASLESAYSALAES